MMTTLKTSLVALIFTALATVAQAGQFLTDFDTAQKKAVAENKPLLVKFTGSDWCPPCMQLNKDVFSKPAFKKAVEKDFVVVVLDFPRKTKLPKEQAAANKRIAKKYDLKSYPTVLLMDNKGEVFKSMSGYSGNGMKAYLAALKQSLRARQFQ